MEVHLKLEPQVPTALVSYLKEMACVDDNGLRRMPNPVDDEVFDKSAELIEQLTGALRFIMAFYEPGQRHLDTNAWSLAEAGGRRALAAGEVALGPL